MMVDQISIFMQGTGMPGMWSPSLYCMPSTWRSSPVS